MIIEKFDGFTGQHCETTATGSLLKQIGIELSEPMLFGIGEGLGFIFWNMKSLDFPIIGGRVKPDVLTENICRNLRLTLDVEETSSRTKAWENVAKHIDNGKAVGLKLDCYHLEYFKSRVHFAGHYVAMYGYDEQHAYLVDTDQQGGNVTASLQSLDAARNEKGPMSSRNKSYTIFGNNNQLDLNEVVRKAIYKNAVEFLHPPIKNIGYKGILKASSGVKKWFEDSKDVKGEFQTVSMLMEDAGTGGSIFRNLYRDFLKESYDLLNIEEIADACQDYREIAVLWKKVSDLFHKAGETEDFKYINQASEILMELSERERAAMEKLSKLAVG